MFPLIIGTSNNFQELVEVLFWFSIDLINHIIQTTDYHMEGHIDKITLNDCWIDHSFFGWDQAFKQEHHAFFLISPLVYNRALDSDKQVVFSVGNSTWHQL